MRYFLAVVLAASLTAQHHPEPPAAPGKATLVPGYGNVHHPVTTQNATAQKFFDQGLCLIYGFNHEAAVKSFERAADLDPNLAMAWWGIAYSLGTNINLPLMEPNNARAYEATQKALSLKDHASGRERAYIDALRSAMSRSIVPNAPISTANSWKRCAASPRSTRTISTPRHSTPSPL